MEIFEILKDNKDIISNTELIDKIKEKESEFDDKEDEEEQFSVIKNKSIYKERQDKSLADLFRMYEEEEIILNPAYQRQYVWSQKNAILFIESLFMSVPIPTIFVSEDKHNKWELIDGQQRLTSIIKFLKNEFPLKNLTVISEFNNKKYEELHEEIQRFFRNITLQVIIIKQNTDEKMKYDIFSRLNKGSVTLNEQELRNALHNNDFNTMLKQIAYKINKLESDLFTFNMKKRMLDIEAILRFYTMQKLYDKNFKNYKGLTDALTDCMIQNQDKNQDELKNLEQNFFDSFKKVDVVFGKNKFKYYDFYEKKFNKILNRSVLDIQMSVLSKYPLEQLKANKEKIKQEFIKAFENEKFKDSLKIHTNNIDAIRTRFTKMEEIINKAMEM